MGPGEVYAHIGDATSRMPDGPALPEPAAGRDLGKTLLPEIAKDIVRAIYQNNFEPLLAHTTDDCLFIGAGPGVAHGKDELVSLIEDHKKLPTFAVRDASFSLVPTTTSNEAVIVGFYAIFSDAGQRILASERQRITMNCRRTQNRWQIYLLHCSNERDPLDDSSPFSLKAGTQTYRYVRDIIRAAKMQAHFEEPVPIPMGSSTIFIDPGSLVYAKADAKETQLHFVDHTVTVKMLITDVCKLLPRQFVRVHRSYAVNRYHIASIERGRLTVSTGQVIPIPRRKQIEVECALVFNDAEPQGSGAAPAQGGTHTSAAHSSATARAVAQGARRALSRHEAPPPPHIVTNNCGRHAPVRRKASGGRADP